MSNQITFKYIPELYLFGDSLPSLLRDALGDKDFCDRLKNTFSYAFDDSINIIDVSSEKNILCVTIESRAPLDESTTRKLYNEPILNGHEYNNLVVFQGWELNVELTPIP